MMELLQVSVLAFLSFQFLYSGYYSHINVFNFHLFTHDSQICEYFSGTHLSLMFQIHITNYLLTVPTWWSRRHFKHNIPQNWIHCLQPHLHSCLAVWPLSVNHTSFHSGKWSRNLRIILDTSFSLTPVSTPKPHLVVLTSETSPESVYCTLSPYSVLIQTTYISSLKVALLFPFKPPLLHSL